MKLSCKMLQVLSLPSTKQLKLGVIHVPTMCSDLNLSQCSHAPALAPTCTLWYSPMNRGIFISSDQKMLFLYLLIRRRKLQNDKPMEKSPFALHGPLYFKRRAGMQPAKCSQVMLKSSAKLLVQEKFLSSCCPKSCSLIRALDDTMDATPDRCYILMVVGV